MRHRGLVRVALRRTECSTIWVTPVRPNPIRNCDFFPCKQFKIVLGNIQINEYDEKNYETMNFKITLPTEKTHEKSGIVPGDFKWYRNISPRKIKFKGGDLMFQLKHSLIRSKNFR